MSLGGRRRRRPTHHLSPDLWGGLHFLPNIQLCVIPCIGAEYKLGSPLPSMTFKFLIYKMGIEIA